MAGSAAVEPLSPPSAWRGGGGRGRRVLGVARLCVGIVAAAAAACALAAATTGRALAAHGPASGARATAATGGAATGRVLGARLVKGAGWRTACRAEAFDPFGWKGQFKDSVQGLMDGLQEEEAPSKQEERMILEVFREFDKDKDGILCLEEFNSLQVATEGEETVYTEEQLKQLLVGVNPDIAEPHKGMPFADYRRLYVDRRLRNSYGTDVARDYMKVFGPGGPQIDLQEGAVVCVEGLAGAVEFNGREGTVVAPDESEAELVAEGRVIVKLADGERLGLKRDNLRPAT